MRAAVAYLLIVLFFYPSLNRIWILADFGLHRDYIAKNLCVMRNIANNSCKGCCQLKKKIAEASKQESNQAPRSSNDKNDFSQIYCNTILSLSIYLNKAVNWHRTYKERLIQSFPAAVFHPPCFPGIIWKPFTDLIIYLNRHFDASYVSYLCLSGYICSLCTN